MWIAWKWFSNKSLQKNEDVMISIGWMQSVRACLRKSNIIVKQTVSRWVSKHTKDAVSTTARIVFSAKRKYDTKTRKSNKSTLRMVRLWIRWVGTFSKWLILRFGSCFQSFSNWCWLLCAFCLFIVSFASSNKFRLRF